MLTSRDYTLLGTALVLITGVPSPGQGAVNSNGDLCDAFYDLSKNAHVVDVNGGDGAGVKWSSGPIDAQGGDAWQRKWNGDLMWPCHVRGVLELRRPQNGQSVVIEATVQQARGWVLTIGDSEISQGRGSTEPTDIHDAEVGLLTTTLQITSSKYGDQVNGRARNVLKPRLSSHHVHLTITINQEFLRVQDDNEVLFESCDEGYYSWDSHMYIGINRVIDQYDGDAFQPDWSKAGRTGLGLCDVCVTWSETQDTKCTAQP